MSLTSCFAVIAMTSDALPMNWNVTARAVGSLIDAGLAFALVALPLAWRRIALRNASQEDATGLPNVSLLTLCAVVAAERAVQATAWWIAVPVEATVACQLAMAAAAWTVFRKATRWMPQLLQLPRLATVNARLKAEVDRRGLD